MLTAALVALFALPLVAFLLCLLIRVAPAYGDYIPAKDLDADSWFQNFNAQITANPTTYGLVAGDATAFDPLADAFSNALTVALTPSTRTKVTVAAKDSARAAVTAAARQLAAKVQAYPSITPTLLADLGLTVRDVGPTPISAPATQPILGIQSIGTASAVLRFVDELTPDSRRKPAGVIAMQLFMKTGPTPPTGPDDAEFVGPATKNPHLLDFSGITAGTNVWLVGRWQTRTGLTGPMSSAIQTTVAA